MTPDPGLDGLHEALITRALAEQLEHALQLGGVVDREPLEEEEVPEVLARHIEQVLRRSLAHVPTGGRRVHQARIANRILGVLRDELDKHGPEADQDLLDSLEQLLEVQAPTENLAKPKATVRPSTPFGATDVLMNLRGEPAIGRGEQHANRRRDPGEAPFDIGSPDGYRSAAGPQIRADVINWEH